MGGYLPLADGTVSGACMSVSLDRRLVLAGLGATAAFAPFSASVATGQVAMSPAMRAAVGEFLDANCFYHQSYRALPTEPMAQLGISTLNEWGAANVRLRGAVETVMSIPSASCEDVRMKQAVYGCFFMRERPPEAYAAQAEALRWRPVIEREARRFGATDQV
ncbi:MAG: hypothetical protein F9K29_18260 [Hyphomicrobiaceae bacterium]|nr:MAG: hypothetical protein F9K29_18260 [Hyphomicrobiaceae bacterium]